MCYPAICTPPPPPPLFVDRQICTYLRSSGMWCLRMRCLIIMVVTSSYT